MTRKGAATLVQESQPQLPRPGRRAGSGPQCATQTRRTRCCVAGRVRRSRAAPASQRDSANCCSCRRRLICRAGVWTEHAPMLLAGHGGGCAAGLVAPLHLAG